MNNTTHQFPFSSSECFIFTRAKDANVRIEQVTIIYASLIPLIISANMLLIFGIIKTKRQRFTSSQILFLTLFSSDLTIGVVELPLNLYFKWRSSDRTCLEVQLGTFFRIFPICMSGTTLCVTSIDRYINVVHNEYHKRIVTNTSLTITIILMALISTMWATFDALLKKEKQLTKVAHFYIALSVYAGILLAVGVVLNVALLKNVKQKTQNLAFQQSLDSSLTKTIAIIVFVMVAAYLPLLMALSFAGYALNNSTDKKLFRKKGVDLLWTALPSQISAILNSVIYLARSSRMRRYYYKLFNCGIMKRISSVRVQPAAN